MNVCSWDLGQMIKILAIPIYGKIPLKVFFSGLEKLNTLKLCMQRWGLWSYQVYSNGDHWLTLTYFHNDKSEQHIKI